MADVDDDGDPKFDITFEVGVGDPKFVVVNDVGISLSSTSLSENMTSLDILPQTLMTLREILLFFDFDIPFRKPVDFKNIFKSSSFHDEKFITFLLS